MRTEGEVRGCVAHLLSRGLPSSAHASTGATLAWVAGGFEPPRTLCPIRRPCGLAALRRDTVCQDDEIAKQRCADLRHERMVGAVRSERRANEMGR